MSPLLGRACLSGARRVDRRVGVTRLSGAGQLSPEDGRRVKALRARDEAAFAALVAEYGPAMLRVARQFVRDRAVAEEVVQEAWLSVVRGSRASRAARR